jgi:hypothetical protein
VETMTVDQLEKVWDAQTRSYVSTPQTPDISGHR